MADPNTPSVSAADFDIRGAMKAGYSEGEIAAYLGEQSGFDVEGARKVGYSNNDIIKHLMPAPAPRPEPAVPEPPPSGTGLGILRAAKQTLATAPGEILSGVGSTYEAGGTALKGMARTEQDAVKRQVGWMDRLDAGESIGALYKSAAGDSEKLAMREYQVSTPEQRTAKRQAAEAEISALPPVEDTLKGKIAGQFLEPVGALLRKTGHEETERMKQVYPLTPEEESRFSVQATKVATSLAPFLLTGALGEAGKIGALPSIMGYSGVEAFGKTYDEALAAGATKEDAAGAAAISGVVQGGLNAVPLHQSMKVMDQIPKAFKGEFIKTLTETAKASGSLVAFTQIAKIADNAIVKGTFDPNRSMLEGVGDVREMAATAVGGALLPAGGAAASAAARATGRVVERIAQRPRSPIEVAKPVLEAPDVDSAIAAARQVVEGPPERVDVEALHREASEFGNVAEQRQASLLKLFGGLNEGVVERAPDGSYHYRTDTGERDETTPLKTWEPVAGARAAREGEPTLDPALVAAQRAHYEQLGVKVVYFENDPSIRFDGAVDPAQPNTIFLSNNPERNAAQVAQHEITHVLESTPLPDGTTLADLLHSQVAQGITPEGMAHAGEAFASTAPDRAAFPNTPVGDAAHRDALVNHLIRELGADIGGEAPKFQTFMPKVVEGVEARYGAQMAKSVLQKLIAGIRDTMATLRKFFFRPEEGAEYGQPETVSQNWVTNLEQIHQTLARMYAERYQTQIEREVARLEAMRPIRRVLPGRAGVDTVSVQRGIPRETDQGSAAETLRDVRGPGNSPDEGGGPSVVLPEVQSHADAGLPGNQPYDARAAAQGQRPDLREGIPVARQADEGAVPEVRRTEQPDAPSGLQEAAGGPLALPGAPSGATPRGSQPTASVDRLSPAPARAYSEAQDRAQRLERWLGELDADRRQKAMDSPQGRFQQQTIDLILKKVHGVEDRLTKAAAGRLETARQALEDLKNPVGDSADMAQVRTQLEAERQRMADAAAVGTGPAPGTLRAGRPQTAGEARRAPPPIVRGRAVMPEAAPARPAEAVQPTPSPTPAPESVTPAAPLGDLESKITAERERVWADKALMGGSRPGITRNETFVDRMARERVMREEVGDEIVATVEGGIPEDAIHDISRMYRRQGDETPQAAFDRAVDRWITKEEATAAAHFGDEDVATFDHLKAVNEGAEPWMRALFDSLEEHYSQGRRELPGAEDIPFGSEPTKAPERPGAEAAPARAEQPQGPEAGAEPRGRVEVPREPPKPVEPPREQILPPAPEARPEPKPESPHARDAAPEHQFAEAFADILDRGNDGIKIPSRTVQELADRTFGGTLAEGAYSRDRVYDAMELGVNRYIQRHPERFSAAVDVTKAKATAEVLSSLKDSLPTQTVRAGEKDSYQQFSTPPDYAYAANWVANLKPGDHVLEPSAGVGGLIVHSMTSGVRETTVNELSDKRRGMLAALEPSRITGEDAAQLHNILPDSTRPTVVVMNPPFSRAAERMGGKMVADEGAKHIEQALNRLEPGGRLVAIVGDGMKPEGTEAIGGQRQGTGRAFRDWWAKIDQQYDVRANVGVDREIYTKYGTTFPTRLLVIDKNPPSGRELVTGQVHDAADLIERLKEVRDDRGTIEQAADQSGRAGVAEGREGVAPTGSELPRATGGLGAGEGAGERAQPAVSEPAGAPQPGANGERSAGARAGELRDRLVPVQPEPVEGRATGEPRAAADQGGEPAGSRTDRGGDGVRPDGSGERDEPGVTPAPEDVIATEDAVTTPERTSEGISEAIYENYRPQRLQFAGAKAHPGALVQSAAMASVLPPKSDYKPRLPASLIKSGALSDAQLEAIVYAGHAHSDMLPPGIGHNSEPRRRGFFIGDGTGVGKGREIAGILLDNKMQGRTKAVWISEKRGLLNDAKRDWNGLGQPATEILDHGKSKAGEDIKATKGVLFTTYDTLKSAEQTKVAGEKVRGRSRVDQIVDWLGKDFDGVIAFDESHNLGNSVDEKGTRGVKKAAQKALAGIELQDKLPNARVVYVSATGATEVGNLAYADRLGLWGEGTPFPNRADFVGKVSSGGMAAMELVARDMKALGHYIARSLSYDGVSYDRVEHVLSPDQRVVYDKLAEGWQSVLQNFNEAMEATGIIQEGKTLNPKAKSAMLSAFWGGHQRFFNQIITSMQMPSVIRGVEADIKAKRQAVLQLVNTMESAQERALDKARRAGEGDLEDLDMTPRDQLMQLVEKSFPVRQMENYVDDNGNLRSRGVEDASGNPVLNREAVAARERLLDELGSIRVPDGPLEMLLNHFGADKVAEVTGRGQRVVKKPDDTGRMTTQVEKRGAQANVADANDFQAGKKPILVFSEAGGTGRSYHAAIGSGAEDARRSHYLVQGGWRADKAVQGFGRTHRTSQASAPIFHLVTTDLQGQKRFISSIARRLGQLGALTKGERRTGDQGMFGMRDNLESAEAKSGLNQFFHDVAAGKVEGVTMTDLEKGMGLKLRDPETGGLAKQLPEMSQFLNRVLSLKIDHQNRVFDAFSERMDQAIDRAAAAGTLDSGVETYKADKISKVSEQTVFTDPRSGAETTHVHLLSQTRNHPASFEDTMAGKNKTNGRKPEGFVQNERSGRVFAVTSAGDRTDEHGTVTSQVRLTSPTDYELVDRGKIEGTRGYSGVIERDGRIVSNWKKLTEEQAGPLWDKQVAAVPEFRKSDLHLITGAVLPIWDRLGGSPKIYRLQTDTNERLLGRVVPNSLVDATLKRLGAEGIKVAETPGEVAERVLGGATATLANDWRIKRSRVAGENRLELIGPDYSHDSELTRNGIFKERISYETRYFIPTEPEAASKAIEGITKSRPITSLSDVRFSPKVRERDEQGRFTHDFHANPERQYTPEQEAFNKRQRAVDVPTWGDWWAKVTTDLPTRAAVALVDRYAGIKKRDPEGYVAARIANSSDGAKAVWLTQGTLDLNGRAYDLGERNGGARALLQPLKKEVYDFFFWVASHRAEELAAQDRENRFTPEDIKTGKTLNRGELAFDYGLSNGKTTRSREAAYMDSLGKLNTLNQNILDLSVKGGLLTKDVADVLMKNQFYVPFFRERADGTAELVGPQKSSGMVKKTFGQRLTGGTEKLNSDLVQNWTDNASHIIDAVAKNRAAHGVLEAGVRDGIATKMTQQEHDHLSDKQQKAESTWVMEGGKKQFYHVADPLLLKSVGTLSALADPFYALSASRVATRMLRVGVTHNPVFAIRNLTRDSLQAIAVTPQSAKVWKTAATGISESDSGGALANLARSVAGRDLSRMLGMGEVQALKLSDDAVRVMAGGGLMRIASLSDTGVAKVKTASLLDTPEKLDGFLNGVGRAMHAYSEAVGAGETFNRIALYKKLKAEGVEHDIASFSAQDLTDFSLSGANVAVRYIREMVPFTNSRAQGLYKVGRALSGSDARMFKALDASAAAPDAKSAAAVTLLRTAGALAGLTVATMALDAIYSDDPEYQQRTEYDRQNYWWFRVGDVRARIPMPFEVGALSRIAADTALAFFDDRMSVNRWASNTWSSMQNNLGFGFTPQIVAPMIDLWANKSGTGGAIEPRGMENLRPDQRYTINNTMAARGASSAINSMLRALPGMGTVQGLSPMQLDYLTRAYGGWMAQASLGTADTAIRSFTSEPAKPATDAWSEATQGLIETSPRNASRYVDALYQQAKGVESAFATYKDIISRGQAAEAREFFDANKALIQRHGLVSSVTRLEGDLNKQIRLISNNPDPSLSPERKRLLIMQIQAQKSRAAEQAMAR